ncbi:SDR family NAD(P)-dependent oxidoreductase [Ewingella sp. S1.OA.A_B6]
MINFNNKIAVITGAGRGLGLAYATALAKCGARVVLGDLGANLCGEGGDENVSSQAAKTLQMKGYQVIAHSGDYSQEVACQSLIEMSVREFGGVDILIHNAGWVGYQPVENSDDTFLERVLGINVYSPIWLCKHAWPHLKTSATPRVVLTTSDRAMFVDYAQKGLVGYSAGKMAQIGIMNALSMDGQPYGIRVNALSPVAKTRMWGQKGTPENLLAESVVPAALFLASEACQDSGYILRASNGQFTACRFNENKNVEYPLDLARIQAADAETLCNLWPQIKEC